MPAKKPILNDSTGSVSSVRKTDKIPVFLRLKPKMSGVTSPKFMTLASSTEVTVEPPPNSRYKANETFKFSGIYQEIAKQKDVFGCVAPLVQNMLDGSDGMFFNMGASGSGKSFTVNGHDQIPGVLQMVVGATFDAIGKKHMAEFEALEEAADKQKTARVSTTVEAGLVLDWNTPLQRKFPKSCIPTISNTSTLTAQTKSTTAKAVSTDKSDKYGVFVSMVEIYNDRIFDIGNVTTHPDSGKRRVALALKTDSQGRVYVHGARKLYVSSEEEAFKVIEQAQANRAVHATGSNMNSSRSHCFTTVEVKRLDVNGNLHCGKLSIVDLAGSERNKLSQTTGHRLAESCSINRSLMLLGQCLEKLNSDEQTRLTAATFRSSKLTQLLLGNVFSSRGQKTVILVNIDPHGDYQSASQILRYSALARESSVPHTRIPSLKILQRPTTTEPQKTAIKKQTGEKKTVNTANTSQASGPLRNMSESRVNSAASTLSVPKTRISISEYQASQERVAQLEAALEAQLIETEERFLQLEQEIREEISDEMDAYCSRFQELTLEVSDADSRLAQSLTDKKIELLMNSINDQQRVVIEELLLKNARLEEENKQLKEERKPFHGHEQPLTFF